MCDDGARQRTLVNAQLRLVDQVRQLGQGHAHIGDHGLVVGVLAHRAPQALLAELPELLRLHLARGGVDARAAVLLGDLGHHIALLRHCLRGDARDLVQQCGVLQPRALGVLRVCLVDDFHHIVVKQLTAAHSDTAVERGLGGHRGIFHTTGEGNPHRM